MVNKYMYLDKFIRGAFHQKRHINRRSRLVVAYYIRAGITLVSQEPLWYNENYFQGSSSKKKIDKSRPIITFIYLETINKHFKDTCYTRILKTVDLFIFCFIFFLLHGVFFHTWCNEKFHWNFAPCTACTFNLGNGSSENSH